MFRLPSRATRPPDSSLLLDAPELIPGDSDAPSSLEVDYLPLLEAKKVTAEAAAGTELLLAMPFQVVKLEPLPLKELNVLLHCGGRVSSRLHNLLHRGE